MRSVATAAWLLLTGATVTSACDCGADDELTSQALELDAASTALPSATVSARRPERRFFLARESRRCVIYHEGEEGRGASTVAQCPRHLEPGERIRLAGSTCVREQAEAGRNVPMRCPTELVTAERAAHEPDAGGEDR